jgi:plasmid maintenance system antidote protein VapI
VQRRRVAWRLVDEQGLTVEQAAARMRLPVQRVRVLVPEERDRRELRAYRVNSIPVARVRALVERELDRDRSLCRAEIAHRMGMHQSDLDRALGFAPAKGRGGVPQTSVRVSTATRLARALGRAPVDIEGC